MEGWELVPMLIQAGSTARLYRMYNCKKETYGEPFAMCDSCAEHQAGAPALTSGVCVRECIVEELRWECGMCPFKEGE